MPEKRWLVIDDDDDFRAFVVRHLENYGVSVQDVPSVSEAKRVIQGTNYDIFIIDGYLTDGSGVELAKWIRENVRRHVIKIFVSSRYSDAKSFKQLNDEKLFDYILNKPITPEDLQKLVSILKAKDQAKLEDETDFMDDLREEYQATICDKIVQLEELTEKLIDDGTPESLQMLTRAVHKIAGSAGSYGYTDASVLCKEQEKMLLDKMSQEGEFSQAWLFSLVDFLRELKKAFQLQPPTIMTELKEECAVSEEDCGIDVYVVDSDKNFIREFREAAQGSDMVVEVDVTPDAAMQRLRDSHFHPKVVLVAKDFANSQISGYDILKSFRSSNRPFFSQSILGIISDQTDLEERVYAVHNDIELFLTKLSGPDRILEVIKNKFATMRKELFKIIAVDDDLDVLRLIESSLSNKHVKVKLLGTGVNLIEEIDAYTPDLLIIDLTLPEFSGIDLIKTLRSDYNYQFLPILVLTASDRDEDIVNAITAGADAFIVKPFNDKILGAHVKHFMQKKVLIDFIKEKDFLTGLYNRNVFLHLLEKNIARCGEERKKFVLAAVDIDDLDVVNDTCGFTIGDKVLIHLAYLLTSSLRKQDIIARWEGKTFLIFMEDVSVVESQFILGSILDELRRSIIAPELQSVNITFSAGIACYPKDGISMGELINSVKTNLGLAKSHGKKRIQIMKKSGTVNENSIFVVSSNAAVSRVLQTAFDSRGFNLIMATDVAEALEQINQYFKEREPLLLVLNLDKPEHDIAVMSRLKEVAGGDVRALVFSSKSATDLTVSPGEFRKVNVPYVVGTYLPRPCNLDVIMLEAFKVLTRKA